MIGLNTNVLVRYIVRDDGARGAGAGALALLLCTLATILAFGPDRTLFLGKDHEGMQSTLTLADSMTYDHLLDGVNLSLRHYLVSPRSLEINADGEVVPGDYIYNRFPFGGRLALHVATLPFDDPWSKLRAARTLMVALFLGAATLAYFALHALSVGRWAALTATLLAFGSSYHFAYHDMVATQGVMDLFGVMLVFHGMAVFARAQRLGQLFAKTCAAVLLGWHVFALLLPFVALGVVRGFTRSEWPCVFRHVALGLAAFAVGVAVLAVSVVGEFLALGGHTPWEDLPTVRSALYRAGAYSTNQNLMMQYGHDALVSRGVYSPTAPSAVPSIAGWTLDALWAQFQRVGEASLPYVLVSGFRASGLPASGVSLALGGIGLAATLVAIGLGAAAKDGRVALISLALCGWCWALPMRNAVFDFPFEAMFFVGVPLVLYALAVARMGRMGFAIVRCRLPLSLATAAAASFCFLCSGVVMARDRHAIVDFEREAAVRADLAAIRSLTKAGAILHAPHSLAPLHWKHRREVLLAGRIVHPSAEHVVALGLPSARSLTPDNRLLFLFRRPDYEKARSDLVAHYRTAMKQSRPVVTSDCCDVYSFGGEVLYHDRHCSLPRRWSPDASFFLHVVPVDKRDLPRERREHGFGNYNFEPTRLQHRDGLCFAVLHLPSYDIAEVHTGQFQKVWLSDRTAEYKTLWEGRFSPSAGAARGRAVREGPAPPRGPNTLAK